MLATAVQSLLGHSQLALFIAQAVIIIALARALGLLVRFIGLPMVIAEILTGIVLGPSLLGWLWPQLTAVLFPKSSLGLLQIFAQIGLVLFMFLVGLELDMNMVRKHGRASLLISIAGIRLAGGRRLCCTRRCRRPQCGRCRLRCFWGPRCRLPPFRCWRGSCRRRGCCTPKWGRWR